MAKFKRITGTILERLLARVEVQPNGCWWWAGYIMDCGYGQIGTDKPGVELTHRVSYKLHKGPIPDGLDIDHICHKPEECIGGKSCLHRRCINPEHLEPATRKANSSLGRSRAGIVGAERQRAVTHCPAGHEYSVENTIIYKGFGRNCKICAREACRRYRNKKKRDSQ